MEKPSLKDAQKTQSEAIVIARKLEIHEKIEYLTKYYEFDNYPLPFTGVMVSCTKRTAKAYRQENNGRILYESRQFFHPTSAIAVYAFRNGPWVDVLLEEYKKMKYKVENSQALDIMRRFWPIGDDWDDI